MATIFDPGMLSAARERHIVELLKEIRLSSRRADGPEDRAALAELERELLQIQTRWRETGLTSERSLEEVPAHA